MELAREIHERPPSREKKIKRAIVIFGSFQASLGAVIIAMSFTAFACSSSQKIRSACPYWAGFTVLFTGAVGFLTWKQLSIISIGIFTFLSAISVIVHLVATVLTGDSAGFLKSLVYCSEVKFEHACGCCLMNTTCKQPIKFPSVRDCGILNGFLKQVMYGLCALNVVCCLICLTVTIMGCTLVAQYSRYSQIFGFRWSRRSGSTIHDHRYAWSPYPSDPTSFIPPCAPPVYYPVQNTPGDSEPRYRRPPTVFDPIDFPPPYTSRESSLAGRWHSGDSLNVDHTPQPMVWVGNAELDPGYQLSDWTTSQEGSGDLVQADDRDSIGCIDYIIEQGDGSERDLASTSEVTSSCRAVVPEMGNLSGMHRAPPNSFDENDETERDVYFQLACPRDNTTSHLGPPWASNDFENQRDNVFESTSSCDVTHRPESGAIQRDILPLTRNNDHVGQRLCRKYNRVTRSDEIYCPHNEIYRRVLAPNVNPWSPRRMSEENTGVSCPRTSVKAKRRANSIPPYLTITDHVTLDNDCQSQSLAQGEISRDNIPGTCHEVTSSVDKTSSCADEIGGLFRNFKESKATKSKHDKRRKRPRNNPGHILEKEMTISKDGASAKVGEGDAAEICQTEYKETIL